MAVTDDAVEKLKEMIASGELKPGNRLPPEATLAAELGLSRSSLREAVKALSMMRILDVRRGDGTYVSELTADSLLEALTFIVEFHQDASVLELLEVRRILEPAACARAAVEATPEQLAAIGEILTTATPDSTVDELVAADVEFHRAIAAASGNAVLASLIDSLSGPTQRARAWRGLTQEDALGRTLAEHHSIYEALLHRDPGMAASWATVHISGVEEWLRATLT